MYFRNNEIPIIRNVLGDVPRIELQNHFMSLGKQDRLVTDTQVHGAPAITRDPLFDSMLRVFKPMAEEIFEKDLFPTYSCLRLYREGDTLPIHSDRLACEFSMTVCIAKGELVVNENPQWFLYIKADDDSDFGGNTDEGEAMFYQGINRPHWRGPCPYAWVLQGFWHFVDRNGTIYNEFKKVRPELDSLEYSDLLHPQEKLPSSK